MQTRVRLTRASAIHSLETTHRDSFARSVRDERESSKEQATLQHPIEATDRQIDMLVYELYELTEEEIAVVEGRDNPPADLEPAGGSTAATVPADKELYQPQIEATDRQIDALVYELYGLTEEEIGVVESLNR